MPKNMRINVSYTFTAKLLAAKAKIKKSHVSGLRARRLRPALRHFCCYETMSNCSQNCWIYCDSAVLCFKRLFHIGVWRGFVRPLLATILCIWEIWSRVYNVSRISLSAKKIGRKRKRVRAPILKPTNNQKPETLFLPQRDYTGTLGKRYYLFTSM